MITSKTAPAGTQPTSNSYLSSVFGDIVGGLIKTSFATLILKLAFSGLSFTVSVILARTLNRAGFGTYSYILAMIGFLTVGGLFGMDQLLIRNIAAYRERGEWSALKGLMQSTTIWGFWLSFLMAGLIGIVLLSPYFRPNPDVLSAMLLGLLLLPIIVLTRLRQAALQGLQFVVASQTPDMLLQPLVLLALIGGAVALFGRSLTVVSVIGLTIVASLVALLAGVRVLLKVFPNDARRAVAHYDIRAWIRQALPFLLLNVCSVTSSRIDVLILGTLKGSEAVGVYSAASRGADLITFFLAAFNVAIGPTIARLYAAGDMAILQQTITRTSRIVLLLSLPLAVTLGFFGRWFLLLFGQDFVAGHTALVILGIGQLMNVATGSVGLLLTMSGYEADAGKIIAAGAVWSIAGNALCIPIWGLTGAAIATASGVILWNVAMAVQVRRRIGIHPTPLGVIRIGGQRPRRQT